MQKYKQAITRLNEWASMKNMSEDSELVEIFKDFFTLAGLELPTPIEAYMSDIMAALLDECASVPSEVVDILIAQFNAKKSVSRGFGLLGQ